MPFSTIYSRLKDFANSGSLLPADLNDALSDIGDQVASINVAGGFDEGSNVRRGKCIIATEETRTNVAYGLMPTPDQVENVVLPTDGLLYVAYQATWKETVAGAARATIFLGANALKRADASEAAPLAVRATEGAWTGPETHTGGFPNRWTPLATHGGGLHGATTLTTPDYAGDVTTGQVIGVWASSTVSDLVDRGYFGVCIIFAAAGTYDVSVQFKASSGNVLVKNRRLLVKAEAF